MIMLKMKLLMMMKKLPKFLISFFPNAENLENREFKGMASLADNTSHSIFKPTLKYPNHPRTIAMKDLNNILILHFSNVSVNYKGY